MTRFLDTNAPRVLSVLRFVSALTFFAHGTQKVLWFPVSEMHPPVGSIFWIAGVLELVGGALLMLGLFTRPVAFILSGLMACAYFIAHAPRASTPRSTAGVPGSSTASPFSTSCLLAGASGGWGPPLPRALWPRSPRPARPVGHA